MDKNYFSDQKRITKTTPKRHHFIPQMLIKRFVDKNGKLHCYRKNSPENGIFIADPKNVFVERNLHTMIDRDGNKDVNLEYWFSELEGDANKIIEKIVTEARQGIRPFLPFEDRRILDLFFYYQWKRVPDMHGSFYVDHQFHQSVEESLKRFEDIYRLLTDEERKDFNDPDFLKRFKQNVKVGVIGAPSSPILGILAQKGLGIGVIKKQNKSFILGSFPVVKLALPGRTHPMDPTVEIWLPVAHDVVICPAPIAPTEELVVPITEMQHIRRLNEAIYKQSTVIAARSSILVSSLSRIRIT